MPEKRLTFVGGNICHTNGIPERMIRSLTEISISMIIHSNRILPITIYTYLWPYDIKIPK